MPSDRPLALLAILLILAGVFAVPVSAMIAEAVYGDPMYFSVVLIGMIVLAAYVAKRFVNWANRPPR